MSKAVMDPEEVRRFAEELKRFAMELEARMGSLQSRFTGLANTWKDQEHEKFANEFQPAMKVLKKFIDLANEHAPYLLRKARRVEEYLDQR